MLHVGLRGQMWRYSNSAAYDEKDSLTRDTSYQKTTSTVWERKLGDNILVGFESNEFFKRSNANNDVGSNCSDWVATDQQQKIRSGLDFAEK